MIRILVVDDDGEKSRLIARTFEELSGEVLHEVVYVSDVHEAKRTLSASGFDLLVLDINLPKRRELEAEADGGVELLRWLKAAGKSHRPKYIVGLTAYEASFEIAAKDFQNFIWQIVKFSHEDLAWRGKLKQSLIVIAEQSSPPYSSDGRTYKVDVAVVTALAEPELTAVLTLPAAWKELKVRHDASPYHVGSLQKKGREVSLVAVAASDKGLSGAAVAATKLIYTFRPRFLCMVGICAGLKKRTQIGDVLVADPVWDWGSGKIKQGKGGREEFHPAQYQLRLNETLRTQVLRLEADKEWREKVHLNFTSRKPKGLFRVRVGPVASGASVLQNSKVVDGVLAKHKDLLGIEMEIFSMMFAAHVAPMPRPTAVALKSVCDFGDGKKNDKYQRYAAYTSAAALERLLDEIAGDDGNVDGKQVL